MNNAKASANRSSWRGKCGRSLDAVKTSTTPERRKKKYMMQCCHWCRRQKAPSTKRCPRGPFPTSCSARIPMLPVNSTIRWSLQRLISRIDGNSKFIFAMQVTIQVTCWLGMHPDDPIHGIESGGGGIMA
jgi:hypothetical protein